MRKMAILTAALTVAAFSGAANAAPSWTVDQKKSRIEFSGEQVGKPFTGAFGAYALDIAFDTADLDGSHIIATIDTTSARTGEREVDEGLPTSDWFSVKKFPKAVFRSDAIISKGGDAYEAAGKLSLRGVERDVTLPFTVTINGDKAVADGAVSLVRTDFGVGQGEFESDDWVALEVMVRIHIEASRAP